MRGSCRDKTAVPGPWSHFASDCLTSKHKLPAVAVCLAGCHAGGAAPLKINKIITVGVDVPFYLKMFFFVIYMCVYVCIYIYIVFLCSMVFLPTFLKKTIYMLNYTHVHIYVCIKFYNTVTAGKFPSRLSLQRYCWHSYWKDVVTTRLMLTAWLVSKAKNRCKNPDSSGNPDFRV